MVRLFEFQVHEFILFHQKNLPQTILYLTSYRYEAQNINILVDYYNNRTMSIFHIQNPMNT